MDGLTYQHEYSKQRSSFTAFHFNNDHDLIQVDEPQISQLMAVHLVSGAILRGNPGLPEGKIANKTTYVMPNGMIIDVEWA